MKIVFLGTGAAEGMPAVFCSCGVCQYAREHGGRDVRRRASLLIDSTLLIDLTPDILSQTIALNCNLSGLQTVLFTHTHKEHCYPWELRSLRPPYALCERTGALAVCGSEETLEIMRDILGEHEEKQLEPFIRKVPLHTFEPVSLGDYTLTALAARHSDGAFCYLVERDSKVFLCGNDTGYFPEETWDYLDGVRLNMVSLDCNNIFDVETPNHMNIEDNVTVQRRLFQLGCADANTRFYATHICHSGKMNHRQLDEHMRLYGLQAAYDGLTVEI